MFSKGNFVKLLVIIVVIGFVAEMFVWFKPSDPNTTQPNGFGSVTADETITGVTQFNATVLYYQPYLILSNEISDSTKLTLQSDSRVESVMKTTEGTVVSLKKQDDVTAIYKLLKKMNISSFADASIELPYAVQMALSDGSLVNVTSNGVVISKRIEPMVSPMSKIKISMTATAKNKVLASYQSFSIVPEEISIMANATITKLNSKIFTYNIPWDKRNEIKINELKNEFGADKVLYTKKSYVVLANALNVSEIQEKKKLYYAVFVSEKSVTVNETFADKDAITKDFSDAIEFPASSLVIMANETARILEYDKNESFNYAIDVVNSADGEFYFPEQLSVKASEQYDAGDSVSVIIDAGVIGDTVISINEIKIN